MKPKTHKMRPTQIIVLGFLCVILCGAILLSLPVASEEHEATPFSDSLFTAVSATCVTGLVVVDTAIHWSFFGEAVILIMIQIGGLGFMTMAVMLLMLLKRSVTPRERVIFAHSYNLSSFDGIVRLTRRIIAGTIIFEGAGAIVLAIRFIPEFGFASGLWKSVFHSVSAFCNAGFDIMGHETGEFSNLAGYSGDPLVCVTVMLLIIIGGIGFVVWNDILNFFKTKKRLSVYTKFVLIISLALIVFGTVWILLFEWDNPSTLGKMSAGEKVLAAAFQSVSPRTAGFSTIDLTSMREGSTLAMLALMFVGGASASTAGGVKVATFGLVLASVSSTIRGKKTVTLFRRTVSEANVLRAFSITAIQLFIVLAGSSVLIAFGSGALSSMFEAFSAAGTVGLSLSLTPSLGIVPKAVLMLMMFFGRVGILTVTYAIMMKMSKTAELRRAEAQMLIG